MEGLAKARISTISVLVAVGATSIILMFTIGAGFQPAWFWSTVGGTAVLASLAWWIAGAMAAKKVDTDRFKMPVRPDLEARMQMPQREFEPRRKVLAPRRDELVAPSSLSAAALPDVEETQPAEEPAETEPEPQEPPAPQGFAFRGFTLFERTRKGASVWFFSKKKKPVGGGQPALLPEGYDVRWDKKQRRPVLVPPTPEPVAASVPEPVAVESRRPAALVEHEPVVEPQAAPKPCSAMTSPGVFCENPVKVGTIYCSRHQAYTAPTHVEVEQDGVVVKGKAPRFALPAFEVRTDRASHKLAKSAKVRTVELRVRADKATAKATKARKPHTVTVDVREDKAHGMPNLTPKETTVQARRDAPKTTWSKPVRPRTVQVEVRAAQVHELPTFTAKEGRVEVRAAQAHELPHFTAKEEKVEVRAAKAHELPKTAPKEVQIVIREAEAHELPRFRLKEDRLEVQKDRAVGAKPKKVKASRDANVEIRADRGHFKPMKLKPAFDVSNAKVVIGRGQRKRGKS